MLDEKDKLIFEYLLHNCRTPISVLAKATKLTKPTVLYRIQKLEEKKYIEKYDALLNYNILDYKPEIIFISIKSKDEVKFLEEMNSLEEVETLNKLYHQKNYLLWVVFKTKIQRKNFLKILSSYNKDYIHYLFKEIRFMSYSIFDVSINSRLENFKEKKITIDNIDLHLLEKLANGHGKDSILDLSNILNVNYHTLLYRFKRLAKNGYFLKFIAQPSVNLTQNDILLLKVKKLDFKYVINKLKHLKRIPFLAEMGEGNFYLQILTTSMNEYKQIIGEINLIFENELISLEVFNLKENIVLNRYPFRWLANK